MPHYKSHLLSVFQQALVSEVGNPPPKIDQELWKHASPYEVGVWARNPRKLRRNQVEQTRVVETSDASLKPKFLSERATEQESGSGSSTDRRTSDAHEALTASLNATMKSDVPIAYRNVEIKYSKFGVADFDFK